MDNKQHIEFKMEKKIDSTVAPTRVRAEPIDAEVKDTRTLIQDNAVEKFLNYRRLILSWGTGVGKTRVAVLAMDRLMHDCDNPEFLLVVAERSHIDNWRKEFIKFLGLERTERIYRHLTVICYASLHKYRNSSWTMACFDEAHHLRSAIRRDVVDTISSEYVLAMSATIGDLAYDALSHSFGRFEIDACDLQNAIDMEFLPEPEIVCIPLDLDSYNRTETIEIKIGKVVRNRISDTWPNRWKYLKNRKQYNNTLLVLSCTQKEKYDYINEQFEYWKERYFEDGSIMLKNKWLQQGSQRKKFLGELKTKAAGELIKKFRKEHKRILCFCTSILQADILGGRNAVHSNNAAALSTVRRFNDKEISELFAVGMLVEGVSLVDIDVGIIIQLDGNERQFIQKMGRMFRAERPVIYIYYYKDTRDEEYLNKALEEIDRRYIRYEDNNR